MKAPIAALARAALPLIGCLLAAAAPAQTQWTLTGWNNLGMHCMDSDYSVFSILPPYNTVEAQLISSSAGVTHLITTGAGHTVTYEAIADPQGSINTTAVGKGNFFQFVKTIFGADLPPDTGLPVPGPEQFKMPGLANTPQAMKFESVFNWFVAYGVPLAPYDDSGKPNEYPMMRLVARDAGGALLASARVVLPVSDEMDCKLCHRSGSGPAAEPAAGWINDPDQARDFRLNILRLHDQRGASDPVYQGALADLKFNPNGLYATVVTDGHPFLCAACHLSEALPNTGRPGIAPLTAAMHSRHAYVQDPRTGQLLNDENNRTACYACHPGSVTRCLRGAMGKAVAADGSMALQCQSCHGSMSVVGASTRTGWLNEPNCQSCHTGDALSNAGNLRFTSAFDTPGHARVAANTRFATSPDAPAAGLSLYRFSTGHGGLQCSGCHGSTHAEYPSINPSDNLQSQDKQGHIGKLSDCTGCHAAQSVSLNGGPHGMHTIGSSWISAHPDMFEGGGDRTQCRVCHGADYKGTVLSQAQGDRTYSTRYGTRNFWRGFQVSCYSCHNGPSSDDTSSNTPASVTDTSAQAESGASVAIPLTASDINGDPLTLRIVSQPSHGTVALSGRTATYFAEPGYSGADTFTFAAFDGFTDSNLGHVNLTVNLVDADKDGIPDWWTRLHFGHPTGTAADHSRAQDDPDQDGMTNFQEYQAGTDPLRADSTLRVWRSGKPEPVCINTVLARKYSLLSSSNLLSGSWTTVATNLYGHPDCIRVEDSAPVGTVRFYRAVVSP